MDTVSQLGHKSMERPALATAVHLLPSVRSCLGIDGPGTLAPRSCQTGAAKPATAILPGPHRMC